MCTCFVHKWTSLLHLLKKLYWKSVLESHLFSLKYALFLLYAAYSWMNCNEFPPVSLKKMQLIHPEKINKIVRKPILSHTCYSCMLEITIIICMSHELKWNLKNKQKILVFIIKYVPQSITILSKFFRKIICVFMI